MTPKKLTKLERFESQQLRKVPALRVGDTVRISARIKEGDRERVQVFEGILIRFAKGAIRSSIVVRKISFGVGVERIFPLHAPTLEKIERLATGKVRQARLYYLRQRKGRAARIERTWQEEEGEQILETLGSVAAGPQIAATNTIESAQKHLQTVTPAEAVQTKK